MEEAVVLGLTAENVGLRFGGNPGLEVELDAPAGAVELELGPALELDVVNLEEPLEELSPAKRPRDEDLSQVEVASPPASEPVSSRASLRGITSGTRISGPAPQIGTCWVFVDTNLDALLGALQSRVLTVTRVLVSGSSEVLLALIQQLVPASTIVALWSLGLPLDCPPCTLALISWRLGRPLCASLASAGVVAILATKNYRQSAPPWRITTLPVDHPSLGGVTATTGCLHLFTLVSTWSKADLLPWPSAVQRDLSTLLSYGEPVLTSVPPPSLQQVVPLRAHQTRTDPKSGQPVYHSCGLLPASPTLSTLVHVQHPFGWGIRTLTRSELLQAYDVGDRATKILKQPCSQSGTTHNLAGSTPTGMIAACIQQISPLISTIRGGGNSPRSQSQCQDHEKQPASLSPTVDKSETTASWCPRQNLSRLGDTLRICCIHRRKTVTWPL